MIERLKRLLSAERLMQLRMPCVALLCALTVGGAALFVHSGRTVAISDGENEFTIKTFAADVNKALSVVDLKSDSYRVLKVKEEDRRTTVEIAYTFPVYVTVGDKTTEVETVSATVADILKEAGFNVDSYDMVEPSADTMVEDTVYIDYIDVNYVSGSYTEAIPCGVETVYSSEHAAGTKKTEQGTDGVRQVNYTSKIVNGVTVETVVNSTATLTNCVNTKNIIGTKVAASKPASTQTAVKTSDSIKSVSTLTPSSPIELDANGNPVKYSKKLTVEATAYTYTGNNCSTGVAPQPGYIAVNPKVIPYGTKMYIKSCDGKYTYGYAIAADTGGFIYSRPTNVDLFFASQSACTAFGRRNVEIYIIG